MKRIFIVGIARSGTTLMQSMLGAKSEIYTGPETHLFRLTMPKQAVLRMIHRIGAKEKEAVIHFLKENNKENLYKEYTGGRSDIKAWVAYLIDLLDNIAKSEGKEVWIEKTPMHLYFIPLLQQIVPDAYFIHMIREPRSNIAAVYDVSKKYPESFSQADLTKAFKRYKKELALSEKYLKLPNNRAMYYEQLVAHPKAELQKLCAFCGLEFHEDMLAFSKKVDAIANKDEAWKQGNKDELKIKHKIDDRLTEEEKVWLDEKVKGLKNSLLTYYDA